MMIILHFLSAYHDLEKVSENMKHGKRVFNGTRMPDMSDSAWLALKIKAETQKGDTTEAQSVEPSAERCPQFVGHCQFFVG